MNQHEDTDAECAVCVIYTQFVIYMFKAWQFVVS